MVVMVLLLVVMVVMSAGGVATFGHLCTTVSRGLAAVGGTSPDTSRYFFQEYQEPIAAARELRLHCDLILVN